MAAASLTAVFGCVATDPSLSANAVEKVEVVEGKNVYNVRFQTTVGDIEDKIDLRHEEVLKKREAKKAERKAKKSL